MAHARRPPALPGGAPRPGGAGARRHRPRRQDDGPDARGARASGHRARVDRHPRRRPHRRALSGGPAGDPVAAGPAGARRVGPAHGRGAAARDQARRAHGRPVREHRQDAPGGRLRPAQGRADARDHLPDGPARALAGRAVQAGVPAARRRRGRGSRAPGRGDQPAESLRVLARGRDRHRRGPARVGDVDDARRAGDRAHRRQRRRHRRAGRVRGHGGVPGVLGRLARVT